MYPASDAVGVGQDEEAATPVACAHFSRCEQARFCAVAQTLKACGDFGKSQIDMPFDVLGENSAGPDFADDPFDLGPQVARVEFAAPLSGEAEGLAGITGREDMNAIAPLSAVERSEIVPYKRRLQGRVFHPRHESGRCMSFPLDVTHSSIARLCDAEAKVKAGIAGTQREPAERFNSGTCSHKGLILRRIDRRSNEGSVAAVG